MPQCYSCDLKECTLFLKTNDAMEISTIFCLVLFYKVKFCQNSYIIIVSSKLLTILELYYT